MRFFRVKNFDKFQHYKSPRDDATPAWIKLYRSLLDDFDFLDLPDQTKAHLMLIWILASQRQNRLPYDARQIGKRIGATTPVDLECLLKAGFIVLEPDDETALECSSETALERNAEFASDLVLSSSASKSDLSSASQTTDGGNSSQGKPNRGRRSPEVPWPDGFALTPDMREFAMNLGMDADQEFDAWRDSCFANDRRYRDWPHAWRNRCRNMLDVRSRNGGTVRKSETPIEMAKRRLQEAKGRENDRIGSEGNRGNAGGSLLQLETQRRDAGIVRGGPSSS